MKTKTLYDILKYDRIDIGKSHVIVEPIMLVNRQAKGDLHVSEYAELLYYTAIQNRLDPGKLKDFKTIWNIINKSINLN